MVFLVWLFFNCFRKSLSCATSYACDTLCLFCLRCYWDSTRSYFTGLCFTFKNLFLHLSLCLCVVARSVVNSTLNIGYLVVCFPGMTSSLAKSKQIMGCALSDIFFLKLLIFDCSSIFIDLIILKAYSEQFTLTLCVYGVEAMRSRQTTIPFPVGIPRWRVKRNSQRRLHGAVIPTSQCHLRIYWRYFAPCGSKMAVKTTSGYGFDGDFWLLVPGFLLESRLLAVYLHAIGQWRLEHSYCKASTTMHKISKYRQSICDGKILSAKARPVAFSGRETSK